MAEEEVDTIIPVKAKRLPRHQARQSLLRTPRSSRLSGRVDVAFRLIDDPTGEFVGFLGLVPSQVSWECNRPAECDTNSITLTGDALPFDLAIIAPKSMLVSCWLYEHQDPSRCANGDPGQFFGVVDEVSRDRRTLRVTLKCRDLTAIPLGAKMTEEQVKSFVIEAAASIEQIVDALVKAIPGTFDWRVVSLSAASKRPGVAPIIVPTPTKRGTGAPSPAATHSGGTAYLADIIGPHDLTVWSAIANVCARAGIVPEVRIGTDGNPIVLLVDASDLQTSDALRPFPERNGRNWRVLVDGDGIAELEETLTLSSGSKRPDFVQVDSINPRTSEGISARWPPGENPTTVAERKAIEKRRKAEGDGSSEEGTFQFVRGITSQEALQRIARAGFESMSHNTYRVVVKMAEPWSAGGGPEDADLLGLGYGAAVEIAMPSFDKLAKIADLNTPEKILAARRVDPKLIGRIVAAQERIRVLSLLFQVERVRHEWSGGNNPGYSCEIAMRRFMGTNEVPLFDRPNINSVRARSLVSP